MGSKREAQSEQVEINLAEATPDTFSQAAQGSDFEKSSKYGLAIIPIRKGKYRTAYLRSDYVKYFGIDTNAGTTEAAMGGSSARKSHTRKTYKTVGDQSANSVQVMASVKGNGTRTELPRGKVIKFLTGATTADKLPRVGSMTIPSSMSSIEIANWIKKEWKQKTPKSFTMGRTTYSVELLAKEFEKLPETKAMKQAK